MGSQGTDLVDVRRLISLVEARPVIWDKSLEEYKCRAAAMAAWRQVCVALNPDFNSADVKEQHNFVKLMMKKWVNVKDSWLRYNKKIWEQKNSTIRGRVVRKYIFNDHLQFLEKNYTHLESSLPFNNNMQHMYLELKNESNSTTETGETTSEGDIDQSFEGNISDISKVDGKLQTQIYDPQPYCKKLKISDNWLSTISDSVEDRHMSFFRGILPTLRSLSENEVLEFQVGVMQLLKGVKDTQKGRNGNNT